MNSHCDIISLCDISRRWFSFYSQPGFGMSGDKQEEFARLPDVNEESAKDPGIDEEMIESLVRAFYGRVRLDRLLGPVFDSKVQDWEEHYGRLCSFWSSVTLGTRRYRGQPMAAHLPLPIESPHFDRWLKIFVETARDLCPPAAAAHFCDRANRIADSLELGIAAQKGELRTVRSRATEYCAVKASVRS
jgi:hemoglobin